MLVFAVTLAVPASAGDGWPVLRSASLKVDVTNVGHYSGNFALETDLGDWFSLSVPFNWALVFHEEGAWKAGTLLVCPEVRYWPVGTYDGPFVGAHFPIQANNVYAGREWPGAKPETTVGPWGGGIGAGYRWHLPEPVSFLALEAGVGGGVYGGLYYCQPRWGAQSLRKVTSQGIAYGVDQVYLNMVFTLGKRPRKDAPKLHLYL